MAAEINASSVAKHPIYGWRAETCGRDDVDLGETSKVKVKAAPDLKSGS